MSDNPLKIYKDYVRANLPTGMSYNTDVDRYQLNDHSFFKYVPANWYLRYISKYGYSAAPALSVYAVNELEPSYVTDFGAEFYRKSGATSTFSDSITHSASSNATMVDSDGLLKWRPHNLLLRSEEFNSTWSPVQTTVDPDTVASPNGEVTADTLFENTASTPHYLRQTVSSLPTAKHTYKIWLKKPVASGVDYAMVTLSPSSNGFSAGYAGIMIDFSGGSVVAKNSTLVASDISSQPYADGWFLVSFDVNVTASTMYAFVYTANAASDTPVTSYLGSNRGVHIWGAHLYRSDLGGMVNNPDRGDSYVPTTSQAVYLPRRGHHVYNGDSWVNKGLLHESEARTNLVEDSNKFDTANWTLFDAGDTLTASAAVSPDGETNAWLFAPDNTSGAHILRNPYTFTADTTYTISTFIKAAGRRYCWLVFGGQTLGLPSLDYRLGVFDLQDGVVHTAPTDGLAQVQDFGNGWYRCSVTITTGAFGIPALYVANLDIFHADSTDPTSSTVSDGNGTDGIYIYGAQLEAGSTPSSYMPTNGSQFTRGAETLTVPAANLPWSSPVVIGEELVAGGQFNDAGDLAEWTFIGSANAAVTQLDGEAVFTSDVGSRAQISQAVTTEAGKVYELQFDVTRADDNQSFFEVGTSAGASDIGLVTNLSVGAYSLLFVAQTTTSYIAPSNSTSGATIIFDNISVKEINPLSVSIQMQGEATGDSYTPLRWYKDANNYITQNIGTSDFTFTQANAGVVDSVTGGSFTSGVNSAFNFASTHASTFVAAAVNGTSLTANPTPTGLTDLSATDAQIGYDFNGTIQLVRVWADDITATGREEASINA